jgi:hypothetical protein
MRQNPFREGLAVAGRCTWLDNLNGVRSEPRRSSPGPDPDNEVCEVDDLDLHVLIAGGQFSPIVGEAEGSAVS